MGALIRVEPFTLFHSFQELLPTVAKARHLHNQEQSTVRGIIADGNIGSTNTVLLVKSTGPRAVCSLEVVFTPWYY